MEKGRRWHLGVAEAGVGVGAVVARLSFGAPQQRQLGCKGVGPDSIPICVTKCRIASHVSCLQLLPDNQKNRGAIEIF